MSVMTTCDVCGRKAAARPADWRTLNVELISTDGKESILSLDLCRSCGLLPYQFIHPKQMIELMAPGRETPIES